MLPEIRIEDKEWIESLRKLPKSERVRCAEELARRALIALVLEDSSPDQKTLFWRIHRPGTESRN